MTSTRYDTIRDHLMELDVDFTETFSSDSREWEVIISLDDGEDVTGYSKNQVEAFFKAYNKWAVRNLENMLNRGLHRDTKRVEEMTALLAESIFSSVYGSDHRTERAEKVQAIYEWLYEGEITPSDTLKTLSEAWREYDAVEVEDSEDDTDNLMTLADLESKLAGRFGVLGTILLK